MFYKKRGLSLVLVLCMIFTNFMGLSKMPAEAIDLPAGCIYDADILLDGNVGAVYINGNEVNYGVFDLTSGLWISENIGSGKDVALALDSSGNPHVAFIDTNDDLVYTYHDGTTWSAGETIDSVGYGGVDGALSHPDIDIDVNGNAHIVYHDAKGGREPSMDYNAYDVDDLMYATNMGGTFVKTVRSYSHGWFWSPDGWRNWAMKPSKIVLANDSYYIGIKQYQYEKWSATQYHTYAYNILLPPANPSNDLTYLIRSATTNNDLGFTLYAMDSDGTNVYTLFKKSGTLYVVNGVTEIAATTKAYNAVGADLFVDNEGALYYAAIAGTDLLLYQDGDFKESLTLPAALNSSHTNVATVVAGTIQYVLYTDNAGKLRVHGVSTNADSNAPQWLGSLPEITNITETGFTVNAGIDEPGTVYYLVVDGGAAAPTASEVKAGGNYGSVTKRASGNFVVLGNVVDTDQVSGLTATTNYDVYFVAQDNEANLQTEPTKLQVTTASSALNGTVAISGTLKYNETLTATVTGAQGDASLQYQWKRNGSDISGAVGSTYTTEQADIGTTISVVVTATNYSGSLSDTAASVIAKADGPAAPTNGIVDDVNDTFDWTYVTGIETPTAYEYSTNGGASWTGVTVKPINVGDVAINAGDLKVRVKATATHEAGLALASTGAFTLAPVNLSGSVSITGTLKYNETLTATVTGAQGDAVLQYQWKRNGSDISGAVGSTYTTEQADIGTTISVVVTATNYSGSLSDTAASVIAKADGPAAPTNGIVDDVNDTFDWTYVTGIETATAYEYSIDGVVSWSAVTEKPIFMREMAINAGDFKVRVKATATHEAGAALASTEAFTLAPVNLSGSVSITGTLKYNETLTATVTGAQGDAVLQYQWKRNGSDISGAVGSTYTTEQADIGTTISVVVTATNYSGSLSDTAASVIAKADGPAAPTNGIVDDVNDTFDWTYVTGIETPTAYEYSTNGGASWTGVTVKPINVGDVAINAGDLKVRVKATATYEAGLALASTGAFTLYEEEDGEANANLAGLTASGITLTPAFNSNIDSYSGSVGSSTSSTTVTVSKANSGATVTINGTPAESQEVSLIVGINTITIEVTAQDGITVKTYTINITRSRGSSSSSTPSAPTPEVSVYQTSEEQHTIVGVSITPTISSNTLTAVVTANMMDALIAKVTTEQIISKHDSIEIKVTASEATTVEVSIPQASWAQVAEKTNAGVRLNAPNAVIRFDEKAVRTISESAMGSNSIDFSVEIINPQRLSEKDRARVGDRPVYDFTIKADDNNISHFNGGQATVNIPYTLKPGENPHSIVVYYLADDGTLKTVRGRYDALTKSVEFKTTHFSKFIVGYNAVEFSDVADSAWYKEAVDFVAARGITTGTGNNKFSPEVKLTRGQYIVMMMRSYGIEPQANPTDNFTDAGNSYYTGYLATAKDLGIAVGIGNNLFAPNREITRQEMFTLLYNALKVIGEVPDGTAGKTLTGFNDAGQIADYAKEAMAVFAETGTISGSNDMINPKGTTTRAEMAQVLFNLLAR